MRKEIKINVPYAEDRANIVIALANSGYSVKVIKEKRKTVTEDDNFYVVFEL